MVASHRGMQPGPVILVLAIVTTAATAAQSADRRTNVDVTHVPVSDAKTRHAVEKNLPALKKCAEEQRQADPQVGGTAVFTLAIDENGAVRRVTVLPGEYRGTCFHKCAAKTLQRTRFPKSSGRPVHFLTIPLSIEALPTSGAEINIFYVKDAYIPETLGDEGSPLSDAEVSVVVRGDSSRFKRCLQDQRRQDPSVTGKMEVHFVIDNNGDVTEVVIATMKFRNTVAGKCISNAIKQLRFRKSTGKTKEVDLTIPVK